MSTGEIRLHRVRAFKEFGLPLVIRTDNGVSRSPPPTRSTAFSKLAVWWLRLGIEIERIQPGQPQQNGRHERLHLTLKKDATKPAAANVLQQQARFDTFVEQYNRAPAPGLGHEGPGWTSTRGPHGFTAAWTN